MSALTKLKVAELRKLCDDNGLLHSGLKKSALIDLLKQHTATGQSLNYDVADDDQEDDEIVMTEHNTDVIASSSVSTQQPFTPAAAAAVDSSNDSNLLALQLKLQIAQIEQATQLSQMEFEKAKWERERERAQHQSDLGVLHHVGEARPPRDLKGILPRMANDDSADALAFFHAFELALQQNDVSESEWCKYLPACLSPKAAKVYALLTLDESKNYQFVKSQILQNFRLTPSAYLAKFRTAKRQGQETYRLFVGKLRELHSYWMESIGIDSLQKLIEQNILEQFLSTLPSDIKRWVDGKQPATVNQAAEYADLCYQTQYRGG